MIVDIQLDCLSRCRFHGTGVHAVLAVDICGYGELEFVWFGRFCVGVG